MAATNDSEATTVFVLGLVGVLFCPIASPFAWSKGNTYVQACAAVGMQPNGLGVAGRILGMIGTGLMALWLLAFMAGLLMGIASG